MCKISIPRMLNFVEVVLRVWRPRCLCDCKQYSCDTQFCRKYDHGFLDIELKVSNFIYCRSLYVVVGGLALSPATRTLRPCVYWGMGLGSASVLCTQWPCDGQMSVNNIHKADNGRSQAARSVALWLRLLVVAAKPKTRYRF